MTVELEKCNTQINRKKCVSVQKENSEFSYADQLSRNLTAVKAEDFQNHMTETSVVFNTRGTAVSVTVTNSLNT